MTYELGEEGQGASRRTEATLPRVFVRESGWRVALKVGSEKTFCYQMAPGEDHYHRLLDGEVYVYHGEERLCLPCAERRGLIVFAPRLLREQMAEIEVETPSGSSEYDLG